MIASLPDTAKTLQFEKRIRGDLDPLHGVLWETGNRDEVSACYNFININNFINKYSGSEILEI